ncbi:PPE family protein [Mycobacterium bourgelatii]|uniref:Ribulose-phosphate 3-epimerase n=1 Tax=Mycobacterium bourgelatii TaxID=1273442 RepID=A0A7I9YRP0_MYCBU|nr:PPE family protein [Mycobacterium bourgelatii]MCV6974215.1 PPE family protein [Mycobacterium bourgelatii]GFG91328.1 ribulose-phosphate 3-epimerase [Mycobacterium bourgelatii]
MDFGALPPEVNSSRMYTGAGVGSMLTAAAAWDALAADLHVTAGGYQSAIEELTQSWMGPSLMAMVGAVTPYLAWLRTTASQCQQAASQAAAAAAAYEAAFAMTVPPPMVVANRVQLAALIATNILGQNTPAIMATEAEYAEMWAQDATAMYDYAASSAAAASLTAFTPPPHTTNPGGLGAQSGTVSRAMSSVPQALQTLGTPGASAASGPATALSGLSGLPAGNGVFKSLGKGAGALEGAVTGLTGLSGSQLSLVEDSAGLGMDAVGLVALDGGGVGLDVVGVGLDVTGFGELSESAGLEALGGLGSIGGVSAGLGQASSLGTLSVPPSWAGALAVPASEAGAVGPGVVPGAPAAMPVSTAVSKIPLGGMVGRSSEGPIQRIGMRSTIIPHLPGAG